MLIFFRNQNFSWILKTGLIYIYDGLARNQDNNGLEYLRFFIYNLINGLKKINNELFLKI